MTALGMIVVFAGWSAALYGYCLFRGYMVTPKQLFSSKWPPGVMQIPASTTQPQTGTTVTV